MLPTLAPACKGQTPLGVRAWSACAAPAASRNTSVARNTRWEPGATRAVGVSSGIERVVIIGAGQAGGEAANRLRQNGFGGAITLIGEEPLAPYQRPPLSKKYLLGELGLERLLLKPSSAYAEENVTLLTGKRAVWIDRARRQVRLEGLADIPYDALILATGSRARALPLAGADLAGVHLVRTAADVDAIRAEFRPGARLAVIGAGYIGLEVAAVARQSGLEVTVLEAAPRPLSRVTSPEVAGFFLDEHVRQGVRFKLGAQAALIKGEERATAVALTDGTEVPCDLVIAGIGILPETSLAQSAGLTVEDGIVTDAACRTSDPAIFAIGDCARRPLAHYAGRMARLESVHNALEGAKIAAAHIAGTEPPTEEAPWFWSDQYDLKLQIAGLFQGYDHLVMRGDPKDRAFAAFYFQGDRLIAVDAVNRPAEFLGAKQLIQRGKTVAPALLADMSQPMKDIVATAA
jgi:3-phenylpropionate/trans-cinnamate dioxygenase ferredoxin reductase subunit